VAKLAKFVLDDVIGSPGLDVRDPPPSAVNLLFHLRLVIVIVGQRCVNLCQGQVRILAADVLGVPMVSKMVLDNFDDLGCRPRDYRYSIGVDLDVRVRNSAHWLRPPMGFEAVMPFLGLYFTSPLQTRTAKSPPPST
jgi:hypothetical protein